MTDIRYCPECGEPILADARTCHHCDADVEFDVDRGDIWRTLQNRLSDAAAGKYEIEGLIGYGGMAGVYLARDVALNRHVALKLISPAVLMDPTMVRRFRQEAQTMAQLNHRHVVPVYDIREEGDLLYIVMQYVSGRTLAEVVTDATGGLPPELVATWMVQICDALAHAHSRGTPVIHRDIKPSNILLDDAGQALLTDFGIAKVQGSSGLTRTGHLIGTPAYMSPEQCRGDELTVGSDQYSLGTVAYELLAGVPPFRGPTLMVLQSHSAKDPEKLTHSRPECPPRLAAVVERMLAKFPQDRWPSMADVTDEFRKSVDRLVPASELRAWGRKVKDIGIGAPLGPLTPGTHERLLVRLLDSEGSELSDRRVRWSSTNKKVASITLEGVVTAHSVGRAVIVGRSGGAVTTIEVEVVLPEATRLDVEPAALELHVGQQAELAVRAYAADGSELPAGPIDWIVEPAGVAAVDGGVVRAMAPGDAVVAALSGSLRGDVRVAVLPVPIAEIVLEGPPELEAGDHHVVSWRAVGPSGKELEGRPVTWSSSAPEVATVDQSGKIFALSPGGAVISAVAEGVEGTLAIEIRAQSVAALVSPVTSVELSQGEQHQVDVQAVDRNGRPLLDRTVSWASSDPSVVAVSEDGQLDAQGAGTASLTARCDDQAIEILVVVREAGATVVIPRPPAPPADHTQVLSGLDWGSAKLDLVPPTGAPPSEEVDDEASESGTAEGGMVGSGDTDQDELPAPPVDEGPLDGVPVVPDPDFGTAVHPGAAGPPEDHGGMSPPPPDDRTVLVPSPVAPPPDPAPSSRPHSAAGDAVGVADPIPVKEVAAAGASAGAPAWLRPAVGAGVVGVGLLAWLFWPGGGETLPPLTVTASPDDTTVVQGATFQLRTDVATADLAARGATWATSDPGVVRVSDDGLVEAVGPGNAALSLTGEGLVTDGPRTISVVASGELAQGGGDGFTDLVFDPVPASVTVNQTVDVAAWLLDGDAERIQATDVAWSSSDEGVLAADGNGRFRAVGPGRATIVAIHSESDLTRQTEVTVSAPAPARTTPAAQPATPATTPAREQSAPAQPAPPRPTRVAIQGGGGPIEVGQGRALSAQVLDDAGRPMAQSDVGWSSSAPDRVRVGADGRVTALAAGNSWVIASSGSLRDSLLITATEPAPPPPPDPATLSEDEVGGLVERIAGLLSADRHSEVLELLPAGSRDAHERYVSVLNDGRFQFDGSARGISLNGQTVSFTIGVRSRTSFGGTREGEMQFVATLEATDGAWRIVRLEPAPGSTPP